MAPVTILLTHPLPFDAQRKFPPEWRLRVLPGAGPLDRAAALRELPGCQGLLCLLTDAVDREIIDGGPDLRIIANVGVGYNNIDWAHARERGLAVTNTPGALTEATADLTLALILAACRRVVEGDRFLRAGRFAGWDLELLLGLELRGAVLGSSVWPDRPGGGGPRPGLWHGDRSTTTGNPCRRRRRRPPGALAAAG